MPDESFDLDVYRDLLDEGAAVGHLAGNEKLFLQTFQAFRAQNRDTYLGALREVNLLSRCRLVCEWIRIKECVFLCLELCGPPKPVDRPPDPHVVIEAIARITANPKLVQQLVQIVEKRDKAAFAKFVTAQKIGPFCHFFCHWVCVVRYRLLCEWICGPIVADPAGRAAAPPSVAAVAAELEAAGHALRELAANKQAFDAAVAASQAGDSAKLQAAIAGAGLSFRCRWVCEWFCSWRCVWACLTICRQFPPAPLANEPAEAFAFAQATSALAKQPLQLQRLSNAVGAGDAKTFTAIVTELKLQRFCIQLCHWICFLRCRRFCTLVCPPPGLLPKFTSIGVFDYLVDVNSTLGGNGLTTGATPNYAFFDTLRLHGILTQTLGGLPMEYRFETITTDAAGNPTGAWTPVHANQVAKTQIGWWERFDPFPTPHVEWKRYWVNNPAPGPFDLVAPISADGWIQVPQENNVYSIAGAFSQQDMLELMTNTLAAFPAADETGVTAGNPAAHPLAEDVYYGIRMRVRQVGIPGSETDGGTCVHIALDDTLYDNIVRHPDWDGGPMAPGQLAVCSVDIAELIAHPCGEITDTLNVQFTSAHPNLGDISLRMDGPGGPYAFTLPPLPETGDYYGTATPSFDVRKLKPCAYLVTLTTPVLLTDGDHFPDPLYDQIAFCKK